MHRHAAASELCLINGMIECLRLQWDEAECDLIACRASHPSMLRLELRLMWVACQVQEIRDAAQSALQAAWQELKAVQKREVAAQKQAAAALKRESSALAKRQVGSEQVGWLLVTPGFEHDKTQIVTVACWCQPKLWPRLCMDRLMPSQGWHLCSRTQVSC